MSWQNVKLTLPKIAASAIGMYVPVVGDATVDGQVVAAATVSQDTIGVSLATVPTYGYGIPIAVEGVTKMLVAASVGANARVGVASTNGGIGPVTATGAAPSGATARIYSIGITQEARAAGEYASVFIDPREIV